MHRDHAGFAFGFLLANIAQTLVERDVRGHQPVGVEPRPLQLVRAREGLGMPQQPHPMPLPLPVGMDRDIDRSEEHTSELQSLMRISYAVFCLKKKTHTPTTPT